MTSSYRFAGQNIYITTLGPEAHALCADYRAEGEVVFSIATTQADIDFERAKAIKETELEGRPYRSYSDGYLETLAVYRKIAEKMPDYDTILFHGSCVAVDGAAYLFTAKSGTGKSTHTRLWRELLGERAVMVNDDKPLIHIRSDGGADVFGSPWSGKHGLNTNICVPLRAVCIITRSRSNRINEISKREAYPILLQQIYRPYDIEAMEKTLGLIESLDVKFYSLGCNMDISAAELAYNTMKG